MKEDLHLITRARQGDRRALNRLFEQWYPDVYRIAYRYFSDLELAGEVTQQTFVVVQQKLGQLRDPGAFRVWLYRTVINQCHSEARREKDRRRRQTDFGNFPGEGTVPAPDADYQRRERAEMILAALQQIPPEQRLVIIMKEYEGLTFREIAEVLDKSENTVKSRLYYGLKALRTFFLTSHRLKEIYYDR